MKVLAARSQPFDFRHRIVDIDLMSRVYGATASWSDWRHLRGGGLLSWLRWGWSFGSITDDEDHQLMHERMTAEKECHELGDFLYCFCAETFESREWERHYRAALELLS